ncbi:carbohydrate kinase [Flagellimonas sp. HMM57]|uniref:xylulokinase n=1 Tax=unclassified Flagellimonas TaxID=2644544 RepID=UPI001EFF1674|nr:MULTISPECIES: FGGY family carbohydrate kinase [unclassified Flagellimonas]UII76289.1 carbohydrate kinase [Flagellimonas sp. HMM57]
MTIISYIYIPTQHFLYMYYIGYDIGSSSIKAALLDGETNVDIGVASSPNTEMAISSPQPGWAEQDPVVWWEHIKLATRKLLKTTGVNPSDVKGIGISYQMHGLVLVDKQGTVLRPSIIWCDSRAVGIGNLAFETLGQQECFDHILNSPGNFTASKLRWIKENEPDLFDRIFKFMLPGDYIALRMTGEANTTVAGLSEGMLWNFDAGKPYKKLLDYYEIPNELIPSSVPTFSEQGYLTREAANELGLNHGIPVGYRAGDQPNNAMSLGVLEPGQVAATGGTSGVVYGITDNLVYEPHSRVNSFAHVNHSMDNPHIGVLLCINGSGIQYRWIKEQLAEKGFSYDDLEEAIKKIPIGAEGLRMLPFGNGAERILNNVDVGCHLCGLQFNRHSKNHLFRSALEGIAYSFAYGMEIMNQMGMDITSIRVGNDNLFRSEVFGNTVATLMKGPIDMVETTGAIGAARAAAYSMGQFSSLKEAMAGDRIIRTYEPATNTDDYYSSYRLWKEDLKKVIGFN